MRILVTGGTGNVGRSVVEQLVRAGVTVRVLTRRPSRLMPGPVEAFTGDLADPQSLRRALAGVDRMYLFPFPATAPAVVRLAERAGVRRIVTLSSGAVSTGYDTNFHLPVEQAVERSALEWTHVRPAEFMLNNLWLWGPSIRAEQVVREPFPDRTGRPVHERDIADVATAALLGAEHHGAAYTLYGPETISRRDQVRLIAGAIGQEIRLEVVTPARARELYLAQGGFAAASADFLTGFQTYSGDAPGPAPAEPQAAAAPGPMPTAADVTGTPARPFAAWAREHADDFRG
ncbi:SDR family oxidoreductase [Dactylosporangium matsuzakiense]|uniref:Nucleotide-diphosphate-sugar epimerase n=1 Tax=Dactylosporangium matsuzakiense TaxID=53360 RepID=A0A9W6KTS7_9ACTN|nr:NAD(P)H-binding protein [Dactylosporangium matsuzakiense]UWZ48460.1 NAD(P)H-binding protein [Dactylosporangium matsuzakiense]GLL06275.1 nucleotide-diphosphate-sugar epimerase [Dactylosporangium matsuzakiense]